MLIKEDLEMILVEEHLVGFIKLVQLNLSIMSGTVNPRYKHAGREKGLICI